MPRDPQVDRHAGDRGLVERVDDRLVDDRVALHLDPRGLAALAQQPHLLVDLLDQAGAQSRGRDKQPVVVGSAAVPGEVVEQVGDVLADLRVGGEQPVVLIQPGGLRMVVAGADVAEPAQRAVRLLADDEHHLAVRLEPDEAVDDMAARFLELARPGDVGFLVTPRLDLHDDHDLLAGLGGVDQRVDDLRVAAGAVQRVLDRQHPRIGGGRDHQALHARGERVVGQMHEHVALGQRR